jgi:hypothetical protein
MATNVETQTDIRFEGFTPGTDIWGTTQANFLIRIDGLHARETAVQLNDPAAKMIAEAAGGEDSPEFRERAAQVAGQAILEDLVSRGAPVASTIVASRGYFEENPGLLDRVKAALS